jgi:cobalt-zinc-cadmium efflux system protein
LATRWFWIDPAISLGICIVLAIGTWRLLAESLTMLMNAAPDQIDLGEVKQSLLAEQAVECVEDVHVWSVSTTEILLTARICCPELDATQQDAFLEHVHEHLEHDFGISHATLEIIRRKSKNSDCSLDSAKTRNILT